MTIKDIREFTGLNQYEFCKKYKIPKSTFDKLFPTCIGWKNSDLYNGVSL